MKKLTGFGIGFAVFIFFLNLIGCYDFVMVMTRNQTYFAEHYTPAVKVYFTNYPIFFVIVWFCHLSGGVLCPIFYLFRRKSALILAGSSLLAQLFWDYLAFIVCICLKESQNRKRETELCCPSKLNTGSQIEGSSSRLD